MAAARTGAQARLAAAWHRASGSFWAVPALMCLLALVLSQVLVAVDHALGPSWTQGLGPLGTRSGPSGSRDVLGAIAGSMLSVASTTFSITIAVMTLTSSSYGPHLVRSFMADRATHVVLGTFDSTSLYALLVLRSVTFETDGTVAFVPHLAVLFAVVAAVGCIAVLVFFIHHVSESVQVVTLSRRVCDQLRDAVGRLYPEGAGDPAPRRAELPPGVHRGDDGRLSGAGGAPGEPVRAGACGYVAEVALEAVEGIAQRHDVLVRVASRPGRYAVDRTVLLEVLPAGRADEDLVRELRSCVDLANSRSSAQDVEFVVQQLVELMSRALSSGVNDPYTAVTALDDLSGGLVLLVARPVPAAERVDPDGVVRLVGDPVRPVELVDQVFDALRAYATTTPQVVLHAVDVAERLDDAAVDPAVRSRLREQLAWLVEAYEATGPARPDLDRLRHRSAELLGQTAVS
ncbi:DUF2254 domain-containing protein [Quadrisphaera setariae]|uniref:DUF2254 domain-containing protein n=1 Tax=Quadrisphaera setariae TaxID=2593304 RepID=A0A5C8ZIU1_9ACTN|nr:DUF2254 domain-containing protein [Quadrisphaera setariae]TXR57059.1 DUF2254 domain-containing protein [Quadrisphaera setariae]